ncbi:phage tail tape measure protein [Desulfoluna spongiiphila]|uniref:Phage tail tape measure protein, TP901 family, core region n=1 Tax=Desulfoluna spongiiphila TaxID=419481 RepID=A0A1G5G3J9_9BACT|nr:phage tail tape measure protein [Desulfoluna spongiiphila]SCY45929.1 phage tail tape measure protein, TP901 family, core region [Desulfoluna spongiiphila]
MASQLQKLMFTIDLMDKVTGPAGKIKNSLEGVTDTFSKVAGGAAGVAAAGYAVSALTAPANEFNMAIGEVRSLDVAQDSLDMLADKAIAFSVKYGESAKDFVSSSYDIQSAIAGLSGEELSSFTNASNILAKGTKSDAATITDYMGTMYGIFADSANAMGKADWVEQLTGQTATAVQMFKTTGSKMADGFSGLGAAATTMGVSLNEQMAIMGNLQATMSGGESATKYAAFIGGAVQAQEKLGLSFFNSAGKMRPMTTILESLQGKIGDLGTDAQFAILKDAFGSEQAVDLINLLMPKVEKLGGDISALGKVKGMEKAMTMADAMVDPFQRLSQGTQALRIGLGQALLPVLIPVVETMAQGAGTMYRWTQEHPIFTRVIGIAAIGVTALSAAVAAFVVVGGVATMATRGYSNATTIATWTKKLFTKESVIGRIAMFGWTIATKTGALVMGLFTKQSILGKAAMLGWNVITKVAAGGMALWNAVMGTGTVSMFGLNAAMWANPVLLIVGGVVLLTGAIAAAIYYWDDLKAAFMDSSWGKAIMGGIDWVMGGFAKLGDAWDWVKGKFSWIPGVGDEPVAEAPKTSPSLEAPRQAAVPAGGVSQSIATAVSSTSTTSSQTVHVGKIVTSRPINAQEVTSQLVMAS